MKIEVNIKEGNEKLKALEEAEQHIKKAKEIILWALSCPITLEMKEPPTGDGLNVMNEEICKKIRDAVNQL
jgi:hypothetical protein